MLFYINPLPYQFFLNWPIILKPLSQLAPDPFKTHCDRKFSNSYVLSLPLHDPSHLFYARKWSALTFEHVQNSEATLNDSNCCIGSHEHSRNVAQRCVDSGHTMFRTFICDTVLYDPESVVRHVAYDRATLYYRCSSFAH